MANLFKQSDLFEQSDGQYSFIDFYEGLTSKERFSKIIEQRKKQIANLLYLINLYKDINNQHFNDILENEIKLFAISLLNELKSFNENDDSKDISEEIKEYFDDERKIYRRIAEIFSFYLQTFIYNSDINKDEENKLNNPEIIEIENFITKAPFELKDELSIKTIADIKYRNRLEASNYTIVKLKPLVDKLTHLAGIGYDISSSTKSLTELSEDLIFKNMLSDYSLVEEESSQIFSMALVYYYQSIVNREEKKAIENYVIAHYPQKLIINKKQQELLDKIKANMSSRVADFITKNFEPLMNKINVFYADSQKKLNGEAKLVIEDEENVLNEISEDELKNKLENFLNLVFLPSMKMDLQNLPIYTLEDKTPLNNACIIILEYLEHFVYNKKKSSIDKDIIELFEDYIYHNGFLKVNKGSHCSTKAKIYSNYACRTILKK